MKKITISVPGISCGHCVHTIKTELMELPGVSAVSGDPAAKTITVEFELPADETIIKNLLQEINYPAQ